METPKNNAGNLTEQIMSGFRSAARQSDPTSAYNRMYEHVYRVLSAAVVDASTPSPVVPLEAVERIHEAFRELARNAFTKDWTESDLLKVFDTIDAAIKEAK